MFGVGMGEFLGLIVLGLFLVGPDKLPNAARDFARFLHKVRGFTSNASTELKKNLGPGYENLDLKDLTPKNLAKKVLGDALEDTKPIVQQVQRNTKELKDIAKIDPDLL
jgi:sec-independent protein translocase protein TatB